MQTACYALNNQLLPSERILWDKTVVKYTRLMRERYEHRVRYKICNMCTENGNVC